MTRAAFPFRIAPTPFVRPADLLPPEVRRALAETPGPVFRPDPIPVTAWDPDRGVFIIGELLDDQF